MDINVHAKIHNKFEIVVKDIRTKQIVQKAKGYNMLLNNVYAYLCKSHYGPLKSWAYYIHYGDGEGDLAPTRSSLFNQLGYGVATEVEQVLNMPPEYSYRKTKLIIPAGTHTGKRITEVGNGNETLHSHSVSQDSEGNNISIGPLTEFQEVTIYSMVYGSLTAPSYCDILMKNNSLLSGLIGASLYGLPDVNTYSDYYHRMKTTTNKSPTIPSQSYNNNTGLISKGAPFNVVNAPNKTASTGRIRMNTTESNGKIWSLFITSSKQEFIRVVFPNALWPGYHFEDKAIGTANGQQAKFVLPWSDINASKQYDFYVDGAKKTKDVDYTLANSENETSITFFNPPDDEAQITGNWWVDYIPKDTDHVLDIEFTLTFGEGV